MIYLNHAATSWPKPASVQEAVSDALRASPETWAERLDADHAEVCRSFGVADPSRLLLTPGATSALNVAVSDHPWERGDRVIVSGFEHHALYRPVQQLADRGVAVVVVPPGDDAAVDLERLEAELRRGRVRLVAMTAASNVTGALLPIETIVALAHEHGALSLIDAAQIAGWIPIDVARLGVDLLAFTGHKGPQAPWGIGGLYVAPEVVMASPEAACELPRQGVPALCAPMPGYCDVGSVDRAALAGLVAGMRWLAASDRAHRLGTARARTARLADAVHELPGVSILGPANPEAKMPTLALTVVGRSPSELVSALAGQGVLAGAGLQCAPLAHETLGTAPEGVIRFSFGPSNQETDVDTAVQALSACWS